MQPLLSEGAFLPAIGNHESELDLELEIAKRTRESFQGTLDLFTRQLLGGVGNKLATSRAAAALVCRASNRTGPMTDKQLPKTLPHEVPNYHAREAAHLRALAATASHFGHAPFFEHGRDVFSGRAIELGGTDDHRLRFRIPGEEQELLEQSQH